MNGAVESGRRAAAEIAATHRLGATELDAQTQARL